MKGIGKMNSINFIIQSVDGIGKTHITTKITEYFKSRNKELIMLDYDLETKLGTNHLKHTEQKIEQIYASGQLIPNALNKIIAKTLKSKANILFDCEAKNFVSVSQLIAQINTQNLLHENEIEAYIHVLVVGGSQQDETLNGLLTLCKIVQDSVKIVVWLNPFFGQIDANGKAFEELKLYKNNREKIHSIVKIADTNPNDDLTHIGSNLSHQLDAIFGLVELFNFDIQSNQKSEKLAYDTSQNYRKFRSDFDEERLQIESPVRYSQAINSAFEKHLNLLSASNSLHLTEACNRAEIVVTQAAEYLNNQLLQTADEIAANTSRMVAMQIAQANKAADDAKKSRDFAIYASIIALALVTGDLILKLYNIH